MSVSRDFIDSYSPEVPQLHAGQHRSLPGSQPGPRPALLLCGPDDGLTKLAFRFQIAEDLRQLAVAVAQRGIFDLALAQEGLERLVQPDCLVNLGAGARPVGPKPD